MKCAINAKALLNALTIVRKLGASPMPARLMVTDDGLSIHFMVGNRRGSVQVSGAPFNVICGSIAVDVETACKSLRGVNGNVDCQSIETPIGSLSMIGDSDVSPRDKGRLRTDIMAGPFDRSEPKAIVEFEAHEFKRVFGLVVPCVDDDPRRYATGFILLDVDRKNQPETNSPSYMVATDTRRLAFAEVACTIVGELPSADIFIDTVAVKAIGKAAHGWIRLEVFANGETTLRCPAAGVSIAYEACGRFPRWRDVIPSLDDTASLYRSQFVKALDDCAMEGVDEDGHNHRVIIGLNGNCRITSHDKKTVKEVGWKDGAIQDIEFHFDPELIAGALRAWTDPVIHFGTTRDDQRPIMFASESNRVKVIVMPLRKN